MNWISVKDKLPEGKEPYWKNYLVVCRTQGGWSFESSANYMPFQPADDENEMKERPAYWEVDTISNQVPFEVTHWIEIDSPVVDGDNPTGRAT